MQQMYSEKPRQNDAGEETGPGRARPKSGGRRRRTEGELIERAQKRSDIASLHDETLLEAPLAALYLGLSENELYELRHPPPAAQGVEGPIFVKHIKRGAVGQNQPVLYFLGELRQYLGR